MRSLSLLLLATLLPLLGCGDDGADDDVPDASVPTTPDADVGACGDGHTVFLSRAGGAFTPGTEDATTNTSSVVSAAVTMEPWTTDDATFDALVACVTSSLSPFDVTVVTDDPGTTPHLEVQVVGNFAALAFPQGVTGMAPVTPDCSPYRNPIIFYDGPAYANAQPDLCDSIVRSLGNSQGLDQVFDARSVMSWLTPQAYPRPFLDEAIACGEFEARQCRCGGTAENSFAKLATALGTCP